MAAKDYRNEPDQDFLVTPRHVQHAKCADPTSCTLALAGQELIGHPVQAVIEDTTGEVRITWKDDRDNFHRAYLRPAQQAIRMLLLTDKNKRKLVRQMPDEGISLRVEAHQWRPTQARTEEEKQAQRHRMAELKRKRKAGELPPSVPRKRGEQRPRPRSNSGGMRGTTDVQVNQ